MTFDASINVKIDYANLAKMNKIRAAARKHGGTVVVQRYARDAYEGHVKVHTTWDEGSGAHWARVAAIKAAIA